MRAGSAEGVGSGSVENRVGDENHEVVGQDHQAEVAALAPVRLATNKGRLSTLEHRDHRFHLGALTINFDIKTDLHQATVATSRGFCGRSAVPRGNHGADLMVVSGEDMIGFGIVTGIGDQLRHLHAF